ncbi:FecR family protein [Massilibacteroides sp.]|uniref:FecR family protein n=1 Tax=Massilibacteroides sp. TaxID=2034766 RepID=UPI0026281B34|nr:FecR family protein [Massilibacteroides sp.]MDD4514049.1 FecR family protein [Massilibacteroides sp.]
MNELFDKYFAGTISEEEKSLLFSQLSKDESLKEEFARLQNVMAVSGMAYMENDKLYAERKLEEIQRSAANQKMKRAYISWTKYAAVIVLLIISWFASKEFAVQNEVEEFTYIEVPKGQQIHVTLADKSEVWLSSRSQLKVSNQFNKKTRNIELDGEAFFSVHSDKEHPFIVKTSKYDIEATGTQFNVFAYSESPIFETDLIEGTVSVYKEAVDEQFFLRPNEKAFLKEGVLEKATSSFAQSYYIKNGIYSFDNKTLKELVDRLELWYDVKIKIQNPEIGNYARSGKFRQTDDIVNILNAIKETGKFNYRILNENEIELYE